MQGEEAEGEEAEGEEAEGEEAEEAEGAESGSHAEIAKGRGAQRQSWPTNPIRRAGAQAHSAPRAADGPRGARPRIEGGA